MEPLARVDLIRQRESGPPSSSEQLRRRDEFGDRVKEEGRTCQKLIRANRGPSERATGVRRGRGCCHRCRPVCCPAPSSSSSFEPNRVESSSSFGESSDESARASARAGAACNCQIYTLPVDSLLVARTPSQLLGECSGLRSPQRRSRLSSRPQSPRTYCTAREDEFDSSELLVAESAAGSHTECKEWPAARSTASCS